jgi:LPXTG-motif cell wall-anchored protein
VKKLMVYAALLAVVMLAAAPAIAENESTNLEPPISDASGKGPDAPLPKASSEAPPDIPSDNGDHPPDIIDDIGDGGDNGDGPADSKGPSDDTSPGPSDDDTSPGPSDDTSTGPTDIPDNDISRDADEDITDNAADHTSPDTSTDAAKQEDRRDGSARDAKDKASDDKDDDNGKDDDNKDDKGDVKQSQDQDADSGDADQSADVVNTGDNVNQCVGILQVANTGNAQNAQGVTQFDSEADEIEFEDGSSITITPQLVVDCRQIILQVIKGERPKETKIPNAKLREAIQPRNGAAQATRSGAGVIVPTSRSGVTTMPKVLSASSAGQPKAALKALPKTGGFSGEYATLLGLGTGALMVGGGLLARRISR